MYDVAVIGGGPVGSRVAYRLAVLGRNVVVVEKKSDLAGPVCCTGIISLECVNHFGIDKDVIVRQANSARVFSPSGKLLSLERPEAQACIVNRPAFNAALAKKAQSQGVEYLLNSPVKSVVVRKDGVSVELERTAVRADRLEARAVVIAAGSGSKLAGGLGLGKVGDFAMGAQAMVETSGVDEVEIYLGRQVAPAFFAWLAPTWPGEALVGLLSRDRTGLYLKRLISSLSAEGKIVSAKAEPASAQVPLMPLSKTYGNRVLVVGGAAGQAKPTTGGGIYYGLLCADIAADSLHESLENDNLSAKRLSEYEKAWKKRLGREIAVSYWARQFFERLSDRRIDSIFDIMSSSGIVDTLLNSQDLSFDWHANTVLKLLAHRALAKTVAAMRLPLPLRKK